MGFNRERGDTVNVVNAPFSLPEADAEATGIEAPSVWSDWLQKQITPEGLGRWAAYAFIAAVLVYAWFGLLAPTVRDLIQVGGRVEPAFRAGAGEAAMVPPARAASQVAYDSDLRAVKDLARQDPRVVANVVKDWVGRSE
jgi:flagellar M-ring protein FliF